MERWDIHETGEFKLSLTPNHEMTKFLNEQVYALAEKCRLFEERQILERSSDETLMRLRKAIDAILFMRRNVNAVSIKDESWSTRDVPVIEQAELNDIGG